MSVETVFVWTRESWICRCFSQFDFCIQHLHFSLRLDFCRWDGESEPELFPRSEWFLWDVYTRRISSRKLSSNGMSVLLFQHTCSQTTPSQNLGGCGRPYRCPCGKLLMSESHGTLQIHTFSCTLCSDRIQVKLRTLTCFSSTNIANCVCWNAQLRWINVVFVLNLASVWSNTLQNAE